MPPYSDRCGNQFLSCSLSSEISLARRLCRALHCQHGDYMIRRVGRIARVRAVMVVVGDLTPTLADNLNNQCFVGQRLPG